MSEASKPDGSEPVDHYKLKELILYVADKCVTERTFASTLLNKILFYADFVSYARYGESITRETYFRLPFGPAPKYLIPVRNDMVAAKELVMISRFYHTKQQEVPVAVRPANIGSLSGRDIAIVDEVIDALRSRNATEVSRLSHQFPGFNAVREYEDIPYDTVYLRDPQVIVLTEERRKKAEELSLKYELS